MIVMWLQGDWKKLELHKLQHQLLHRLMHLLKPLHLHLQTLPTTLRMCQQLTFQWTMLCAPKPSLQVCLRLQEIQAPLHHALVLVMFLLPQLPQLSRLLPQPMAVLDLSRPQLALPQERLPTSISPPLHILSELCLQEMPHRGPDQVHQQLLS